VQLPVASSLIIPPRNNLWRGWNVLTELKSTVSAVQAGLLLTLFFAWNGSQTFKELEVKQSIMIHCVKETHPLLYQ